ncbi:MAG TPA: hypothetical protein VHD56_19990 [Tepidisphaeraceae bacterium]|nr:hypothetical protein [Tepidisphaeraceae bacterium]
MNKSIIAFAVSVLVFSFSAGGQTSQPSGIPAFPGAEGFGALTPGGRGGTVYEVTNLNDSGPGSFRDAVSEAHRTVIFRVSGTIDLQKPLIIDQPFITVAGQTAPGDGICVRYFTFRVQSHDVVVRFIRSRLGDQHEQEDDAIGIMNGCRNVILDHCSATWSVDEGLSTSGDDDHITVQWCLIAEGLNHSIHAKGNHGYGSLARANGSVSWYHNLWAHNKSRNPRLGDAYGRGSHPFFDVRNNVMYDFGEICSGLTQGIFNANYVGNYIRPGPSTTAKFPIHVGGASDLNFFIQGNIYEGNEELTRNNSGFIDPKKITGETHVKIADKAFQSPVMNTLSAENAYKAVLASVGGSLPKRDAADAKIIQEVIDRKGSLINSQNEVGGWPELKSAPAPIDSDHDGLPDEWEAAHGLNPKDPADAQLDSDKDGYTNLEEYLNHTDPKQFIDYHDAKNNIDALTAPLIKSAS